MLLHITTIFLTVVAVFGSIEEDLKDHNNVLESRNGVRLMMYHGGYSSGLKSKEDFRKYLKTYVDFVKEKDIDKVMLSIQDPETITLLKNEDVIVEFMRSLPSYVELGALLEINPRSSWGYDVNVTGGFNPFSKVVYHGGSGDKTTTLPPDPDREAIIKRILSPGPEHCKPRNISESELFCPGDFKVDTRWKETCSGDPCGVVSEGSFCKGPLECHGFPPLPPLAFVEGDVPIPSANTCPSSHLPPPGCPNNIPKAVALLAALNKKARVSGNANGARMFTFVGWDSEDAGEYQESSMVQFYVHMIDDVSHAYLFTIPDGYYIPGVGRAIDPVSKVKLVFFGDSGVYTKNPEGEKAAINCTKFISVDDKDSLSKCHRVVDIILPHIETYPELYWYVDEIRDSGCIGCKHDQAQIFTEGSNYWKQWQISSVNQCSACFERESCKKFVKYFSDYASSTYQECIKEPDCGLCCQCLACLPCAFDEHGRMFGPENPNSRLIYQKYRNNASNLLDFLSTRILPDPAKLLAIPNNWPMFSTETAHNWFVPEGDYKYDAAFGPTTCLARSFNGDTCGTFDGFGNWEWEDFLDMVLKFAAKYKLKGMGIYEYQFIPPHWFTSGKFTHPGPNSRSLLNAGAPRKCPSAAIISAINRNSDDPGDPMFVIDSYAKADSLYHGQRADYMVCPGLTIGDPCKNVNPDSYFKNSSGTCKRV